MNPTESAAKQTRRLSLKLARQLLKQSIQELDNEHEIALSLGASNDNEQVLEDIHYNTVSKIENVIIQLNGMLDRLEQTL